MAKRRDRRVSDGPGRPHRSDRPVREKHTSDATSHVRTSIYVFFAFLLLPIVAFFLHRLIYSPPTTTSTNTNTTTLLSVYGRGLVRADTSYQEILAENFMVSNNTSHRHFSYPVLAYITPWNRKGYEISKRFTSKFTHLSPVWYELKSEGSQLVLEGRHNSDSGWVYEIRRNGNALVLPRVVLEAFPNQLLRKRKQWEKAISLIVNECKEMGYDGIVLESWSRWAAYGVLANPDLRSMAMDFVKELAQGLHAVSLGSNSDLHMQLIYVIPAQHSEKVEYHDFGPKDFANLRDTVDGFSLMTYDFSGPHSPGPNAPLSWIRYCLQMLLGDTGSGDQSLKIFLGINFYGNDFALSEGASGGAITGSEYLSLLEKHKPVLQWKESIAEHLFIYSENRIKHAVFYPSLKSISMRLSEAQSWGVGLSIWEIGQGLDYFFDLL